MTTSYSSLNLARTEDGWHRRLNRIGLLQYQGCIHPSILVNSTRPCLDGSESVILLPVNSKGLDAAGYWKFACCLLQITGLQRMTPELLRRCTDGWMDRPTDRRERSVRRTLVRGGQDGQTNCSRHPPRNNKDRTRCLPSISIIHEVFLHVTAASPHQSGGQQVIGNQPTLSALSC